jgi:leucyl-tRNA synthetase
LERTDLAKVKTGVPTGACVVNPANGRRIEIWVADYVLSSYGSGAVMGVPAHDGRDYEFAQRHGIPIIRVIDDAVGNSILPYCGEGTLVNSGEFNGMFSADARGRIVKALGKNHAAEAAQNYRLRDWIFSRQRYWGEPIPVIWVSSDDYRLATGGGSPFREFLPHDAVSHVENGATYCALPLCSEHLPLLLPPTDNYLPSDDGESPLAHAASWVNVRINVKTGEIVPADGFSGTGGDWIPGRRETNTMPQWAGSCWYHLRYMSPNCETHPVDPSAAEYWQAPDFYIGGSEHAVLHLLYARFWHRFLFDIGAIGTGAEPFRKLFHQGIILGEDGTKMSKSRGNVVNPDEIVSRCGADALRLYEMFLGPLDMVKPWNTRGIEGVSRFLKKIWNEYIGDGGSARKFRASMPPECQEVMHGTIKKVSDDIEALKFNTAISQLMICINAVHEGGGFCKNSAENFLKLLAPFAPHIAEELWSRMGNEPSIVDGGWPTYDASRAVPGSRRIIIQVNGKVRGECSVGDGNMGEDDIFRLAMEDANVARHLAGKSIAKKIYADGKIVNFVVE